MGQTLRQVPGLLQYQCTEPINRFHVCAVENGVTRMGYHKRQFVCQRDRSRPIFTVPIRHLCYSRDPAHNLPDNSQAGFTVTL